MTTEKFVSRSGAIRDVLGDMLDGLDELAEQGGLGAETRATVEQAANAAGAAHRLLELAEARCKGLEFTP